MRKFMLLTFSFHFPESLKVPTSLYKSQTQHSLINYSPPTQKSRIHKTRSIYLQRHPRAPFYQANWMTVFVCNEASLQSNQKVLPANYDSRWSPIPITRRFGTFERQWRPGIVRRFGVESAAPKRRALNGDITGNSNVLLFMFKNEPNICREFSPQRWVTPWCGLRNARNTGKGEIVAHDTENI